MEDTVGQTTSIHESLKMHTKILVRKSVAKRPLENPQAGWGIKTYLEDTHCKGVGWIQLAQHGNKWWSLVNMLMNLQAAYGAGNFSADFTRRILLCEVNFTEH
jgi:hypothetical protein